MARFKSDEWRVIQAVSARRETADRVKPDRFDSVVRKLKSCGIVSTTGRMTEFGQRLLAMHQETFPITDLTTDDGNIQRQVRKRMENRA